MPAQTPMPLKTHQINPKKLLLSKWTAIKPIQRQKHFLVTKLITDEEDIITGCVLEAIINKTEFELDWRALGDKSLWQMGWL